MEKLHGNFEGKEKLLAKMNANMYNSCIIELEVRL